MRSLTLKLTLAFLLVGLTGAALVALIIRDRTRTAFNTFLLDREQQRVVNSLVEYYQANGNWQGVAESFQIGGGIQPGNPPPPLNGGRDFRRDWLRITLVGTDERVLAERIPGADRSIGKKPGFGKSNPAHL